MARRTAQPLLGQRQRNIFRPNQSDLFQLSRSRLENFLRCPRCFYLDRRLGIDQPSTPPFTLNNAVDALLKREFDLFRAQEKPHPIAVEFGLSAVPYAHPELENWRNWRAGLRISHPETGFVITGAIDDVWLNNQQELIVIDYKATAKDGEVSLNADWQVSYKRQLELYQWLFRQLGFVVSPTAYIVYANGNLQAGQLAGRLEFDLTLVPHQGDDSWVEPAILAVEHCLRADMLPEPNADCPYCAYRQAARLYESWSTLF